MDIVLRQNGGEVGRFGLTTNKSDTQTNDVIKIVKDGTTYYGRLTPDTPNTTRKLKVTKNGISLYLQTNPVGLQWAGTLSFSPNAGQRNANFDLVIASNVQYPKGIYKITVVRTNTGSPILSNTFTVVTSGIGDFRVQQAVKKSGNHLTVWCGGFGYYNDVAGGPTVLKSVTVEKIG